MNRVVQLPPHNLLLPDGAAAGGWWHDDDDGRTVCDLCPRECRLKEGDRGFCFVRERREGQIVLSTYGRSTGFCIDPIEKKPLNHFFPGTSVLSFGTAGCNLGCKFCQNWSISKSREVSRLSDAASPAAIAAAARQLNCHSVAFTYNDPIIWAEYAIDTARECRAADVRTVAVTAGYISAVARPTFFQWMDAANVDLKAFTEHFYQHLTLSHLQPVLDTLRWIHRESDTWLEITNLVIPRENDSDDEFKRMCDWLLENVGDEVPVHFTAFHPDFRLQDHSPTPLATLLRGYETARRVGIKHAYVGNVDDTQHQSTYCGSCGALLIERNWYELGTYQLDGNRCRACGATVAGRFAAAPGVWGRKRQPVDMRPYMAAETQLTDHRRPRADSVTSPQGTPPMTPGMNASLASGTSASSDVPRPELTPAQAAAARRAASEAVRAAVLREPLQLSDPTVAGAANVPVYGCFVSLKRKGQLRGCCGFLGRTEGLLAAIAESARTSATGDVRMPSVVVDELAHLDLEIWLLYGRQRMLANGDARVDAVEIGKHGLQIECQGARGLLLPGVATDHGMDARMFLQQVSIKAGLEPTAWRDDRSTLYTFEGTVIKDRFDPAALPQQAAVPLLFSPTEIARLAAFVRHNALAVMRGAVPMYYLPDCSDGSVYGIHVRAKLQTLPRAVTLSRLVLRNPVPLQATLFQFSEALAEQLRQWGATDIALEQLQTEFGVLYAPTAHGTVAAANLDAFDGSRRALMVMEGAKSAWHYDPQLHPQQLLESLVQQANVTVPEQAALYSFVTQTNGARLMNAQVPQPRAEANVRRPAVAGTFYPADASALSQLLDQLEPTTPVTKEKWRAAMVPHAGLIYSGRLAADVLRRIEIPPTVIVIGPKHTALGVDWAVAPHATWQLPGFTVASDTAAAAELAQHVRGLQLDEGAHEREHAIEVELPWLARYAPQAKVIGIAIGNANLELCQRFATDLAAWLQNRLDDTLLLISSDMNHFANDQETRRVDALALEALESLDAAKLYQTVRENRISMCGVLPACIVVDTLRRLGQLTMAKRVAYGTSADTTGDPSRVVGYAGVLFR